MRIGLISDTHDNLPLVDAAVRFLRDASCDRVFHLGDITEPPVVERLADLPVLFLRGNNDIDPALDETVAALGLPPIANVWTGFVDGLRVAALHGHRKHLLAKQVGHAHVVLHGHSHRWRAERVDGSFIVNPGALFRATHRTVALLELPSLEVSFFAVDEGGVRFWKRRGESSFDA